MISLGELERAVMDVLWASDVALSAKDVALELPGREPAITTVLTVLTRLSRKKMVLRSAGRPHLYGASRSRDEHTAELMREMLADSPDTLAVLSRFVDGASAQQVAELRRVLKALPQAAPPD